MTEAEKPKKRPGRPRLYPGTEKRPTLTFRVRDGMHEQLAKAAQEGGRSISEEIERRLQLSFEESRTADAMTQAAERAAEKAVKQAQEAQAARAVWLALRWLEHHMGHPLSIPVAVVLGRSFAEIANQISAENRREIWLDDPDRVAQSQQLMHEQVDALYSDWKALSLRVSVWSLYQQCIEFVLRESEEGSYQRRLERLAHEHELDQAGTPPNDRVI